METKGKGAYSSSWNSPQNYGTPLVNGITQCYLPPRQRWPPRLHPNRAGWYSMYNFSAIFLQHIHLAWLWTKQRENSRNRFPHPEDYDLNKSLIATFVYKSLSNRLAILLVITSYHIHNTSEPSYYSHNLIIIRQCSIKNYGANFSGASRDTLARIRGLAVWAGVWLRDN